MGEQREEYEHPTRGDRVRLNLYEIDPPASGPVARMGPHERGFLVTEERIGGGTVVRTLGFYPDRREAVARFRSRSAELLLQQYRPATPAA